MHLALVEDLQSIETTHMKTMSDGLRLQAVRSHIFFILKAWSTDSFLMQKTPSLVSRAERVLVVLDEIGKLDES